MTKIKCQKIRLTATPSPLHPLPPGPLRLNKNHASRVDSHEEVEESTNGHIQDPELAAIWETLVRIEPNTNFQCQGEENLAA